MPTYDPSVDYSDLIAAEAAKGVNANRQLLAQYEAARNAKITGERLPYAQTALYTSELGRPLGYYEAEDRSDYINEIYDEARELSLQALEGAYRRSSALYDAAAAQVPARYRAAKNSAASDAALTRQSINEQFAASGLNTGAGGQARLSLAVAEQGAMAQLDAERAAALNDIELKRADAEANYRAAVADAIAQSELERAQALYDEAVRVDSSYRSYSAELLEAWGLTPAGTPIAGEAPAAAGGYSAPARGSASGAKDAGGDKAGQGGQSVSEAELLRQMLSRIPGLTRENRATLIRDYYNDGRISYSEMQELLRTV